MEGLGRNQTGVPRPDPTDVRNTGDPGRGTLFIGLRLLALSAVVGSGLLWLPAREWIVLAGGVAVGAALGFAQLRAFEGRHFRFGLALVVAQVALWAGFVHITGGARSPWLVGYLLELVLSGLLLWQTGSLVAGAAAIASCLVEYGVSRPPASPSWVVTVGAFLALGTALACLIVGRLRHHESELERAREQLTAHAESLATQIRLLGEYLTNALVGIGPTGLVVSANRAAAMLLGLDPPDGARRCWQEVLRPDPRGAAAIASSLAEGAPQRGVRMTVGAGGRAPCAVTAEVWASPAEGGRITYVLLEQSLESADEPDPVRRLGESAACVAHQIKNSLQALGGFAERLREDSPGAIASLQPFLAALRNLGTLAEDMLALAGAPRPAVETVDLRDVLSSAVALAQDGPAPVRLLAPAAPCPVRANRGQLVHALFNLIQNACQACPVGGGVAVDVRSARGEVTVEIVDGGPGLSPEIANSTGPVRSARGSGFGLMAARRFLESSGGTLSFGHDDGGRSVCRVVLHGVAVAAGGGT